MNVRAEDLAYGRWPEILVHAGIDNSCFSRKHGPCPLCGGKDRYRWTNKDGGLWVCNSCNEGKYANGFKMLMEHLGLDFRGAADYVRGYFGSAVAPGPVRQIARRAANSEQDVASKLARMETLWSQAQELSDGDPVTLYLRRRVPGLSFVPRWTRFHTQLEYWAPPEDPDGKPVLLGKFPAMLCKAFDVNGRFVQLHKTYLTKEGQKADVPVVKKTDRGVGVNGFAVPMQRVLGDTLGFAEGIESAIAASMLRGIPVWPCLNGPSMAAYDLPAKLHDQVRNVVIFADHDERRPVKQQGGVQRSRSAGLHYAEQLARRVRAHCKRVLIVKAGRVGFDMADHWQKHAGQEQAECALTE
jgi:putative DNA primase/helicase